MAHVTSFLDQYFKGALGTTDLPGSRDGLQLARGLVHKIAWFINDFTETVGAEAWSLQQMYSYRFPRQIRHGWPEIAARDIRIPYGTYGPRRRVQNNANRPTADGPSTEFGLSASERVRLYRAFLQFELCCVLFHPSSPARSRVLGACNTTEQYERFLDRLDVWEVEAIACIHQYLTGIIRSACDGIDREYENAARSLATEPPPNGPVSQMHGGNIKFVGRSLLQFGSFHHFSSMFRDVGDWGEGAKISAGLGFMLDFAQSDQRTQLKLLRKFAVKRDHLYTAISFLREDDALCTLREPSTDDGSQASASYIKHYASRVRGFRGEEVYLPMRALGCVFWDSKRLESRLFTDARHQTGIMDQEEGYGWAIYRYTRKFRPSPEQTLRHVYIPPLYEDILRAEFGVDDC
ncbi:hypothetical protein MY11210_007041 [Beauveria gryllotalpidicola]